MVRSDRDDRRVRSMLGWRRNAQRAFEREPVGHADARRHGNRNADAVAGT
jgi:hypothetical protein